MPKKNQGESLQLAAAYFEASAQKIFSHKELSELIKQQARNWKLPATGKVGFIQALVDYTKLRRVPLPFPYRSEVRFLWGHISILELVQSLRTIGYFSHLSALYLNGLETTLPKNIFFNVEQPPKRPSTQPLRQEAIDSAFQRPVRKSTNKVQFEEFEVCLINGMNTRQLEVNQINTEHSGRLRVTSLERTLVDVTVRPAYSGGVLKIVESYRKAKERVSTDVLFTILKALGFIYPYQQAIGFYMEVAGYSNEVLEEADKLTSPFNFYLAHQMEKMNYSKRWRLYYPSNIW